MPHRASFRGIPRAWNSVHVPLYSRCRVSQGRWSQIAKAGAPWLLESKGAVRA